ncbi:pyridoxal 5'-phosphate synthase glutaminase subunit PdxT [bacterium]|nr:pyridoxal 5'-phosphate synthase glutaminase subunit PdxT [bacterium]
MLIVPQRVQSRAVTSSSPPRAGVLALQGAYQAHARVLSALGCEVVEVQRPAQLEGLRLLCMPGGESTTMSLLLSSSGLREPLRQAIAAGLPVLATCAGAILLAQRLEGDSGSLKVEPLGLLDLTVDRNAYGRQNESFEAGLEIDWTGLPGSSAGGTQLFHAVFIRAPRFQLPGAQVRVLASFQPAGAAAAEPVLVRQGNIIAAAFHPELSGDDRIHRAALGLRPADF